MTQNDLLALLALMTALRVFLPDLRTGVRRLLRAGARVGVNELLQTHPDRTTGDPTAIVPRDTEA
ncbi:hypothetical protein AB9Q10_26580 [Streptomyces krungchingensis]|uniref:hypothetical protein n=1 Tax=Streptomyces krungchingensis TaxID=1565034 RepID=UPI003CE76028